MLKLLSTTLLSLFLLFQTSSFAEEDNTAPQEAAIEEEMPPSNIDPEDAIDSQHGESQSEAQEEISEAQKEAIEAEQAELREAGIGEEPVIE